MAERKSYSEPGRGFGDKSSGQKDDRDREKNLGRKDIGSRHGEESPSPQRGSGGSGSSDMERER